ncbi:MAG: ketopantoate reductase family protein [Deltaproteobacteria bacterium HGW-Deltaproteobacteria-1]|jgi:2-dehydropantoate 2-reductase|nr:MAG: ketopantoate reductase family protein [Deltaproteobacteria bacterium HGW-Deltaproteobacteria-1]
MKILTIGVGVIGTTYSWQLQKAGFDLTHYVRKNKTDEYRSRGIEIHCLDLRNSAGIELKDIYRPNFVDDFSANNGFDYILVSVNSNQLADLLPQLSLKSGNATIVFLQNLRPGDDEMIDQFLDKTRYVIAYPFKAGGGRTGNTIETVIFGMNLSNTVLGTRDGQVTQRVKTLYKMLKKANMNPQIIPNIIPYVRTHYVWAACCVAAYIKAGTYDNFKKSKAIKESYLAMREGWEICMKQGINPRKVAPTKYYYLPFFLLIPFTRWLYNKRGMREMFEGHVQHSPEEMKDMYFTLLAQGKRHGIKMPVYEGYLEYVSDYFKKIAYLQES